MEKTEVARQVSGAEWSLCSRNTVCDSISISKKKARLRMYVRYGSGGRVDLEVVMLAKRTDIGGDGMVLAHRDVEVKAV